MAITINGDGALTASGTAATQGQIILAERTGNGTNTVTVQAPASLAADFTLTLPTADGTNGQFLQTNGSGQLAFASIPPSGMTLIETRAATGSEIIFTGLTGTNYIIVVNRVSTTSLSSQFYCQFGYGSTPTYQASGYNWQIFDSSSSTNSGQAGSSAGNGVLTGVLSGGGYSTALTAYVFLTGFGTVTPALMSVGTQANGTAGLTTTSVFASGTVNSIRIYGGTFNGGSFSLYALA
jgi:hypothetical protein